MICWWWLPITDCCCYLVLHPCLLRLLWPWLLCYLVHAPVLFELPQCNFGEGKVGADKAVLSLRLWGVEWGYEGAFSYIVAVSIGLGALRRRVLVFISVPEEDE